MEYKASLVLITLSTIMGGIVTIVPSAFATVPEISLDQKVYTWTDKVFITIVAPDNNFNLNAADTIHVDIYTRNHRLQSYKLVETGADTGIFTGEVILTGFNHDATGDGESDATGVTSGTGPTNGLLATQNDDGITVSFEFFEEDETAVGSALIRWNIGEVQFLEASYPATGQGVLRIVDPDMNLNPGLVDTFKIDVWSDSDVVGISLTMVETNDATGIFEGVVTFSPTLESGALTVKEGDTVTAEYEDRTLPDLYITAVESKITATTFIGTIVPPPPPPETKSVVVISEDNVKFEPKFITASNVGDVTFNKDKKTLHAEITGPTGTPGTLTMEIERSMLDGIYEVRYGGESIPFELKTTPEKNIVTIHYTHNSPLDTVATTTSTKLIADPHGNFVLYWWLLQSTDEINKNDENTLGLSFRNNNDEEAMTKFVIEIPNLAQPYQEKTTTQAGYQYIDYPRGTFTEGSTENPYSYPISISIKEINNIALSPNDDVQLQVHVVPEFTSWHIITVSVILFFAMLLLTRCPLSLLQYLHLKNN